MIEHIICTNESGSTWCKDMRTTNQFINESIYDSETYITRIRITTNLRRGRLRKHATILTMKRSNELEIVLPSSFFPSDMKIGED